MTEDYKTFLFNYRHEGYVWGLEIKARDQQDALARLAKIPYASYNGEMIMKAAVPQGPLSRAASWIASRLGAPPVGEWRSGPVHSDDEHRPI